MLMAAYYCVVRPVWEIYKIERYLYEERQKRREQHERKDMPRSAKETNSLEDVVNDRENASFK